MRFGGFDLSPLRVFSPMLSVIMSSPDFAEVCFLVAFIVFAIEFVAAVTRPASWVYDMAMVTLGLGFLTLGFLAL